MDLEKKAYAITDRAGWYVAGRKVPSKRDEDGNFVPQVGFILWLTEPEARHELRNLTIQEVDPVTEQPVVHDEAAVPPAAAIAAPAGDAPLLDAGAQDATVAASTDGGGKRPTKPRAA